jgi:diaminopimelate epimerase
MRITFTKMHGLGNDFVVIDAINQAISLTPEQIRFIADRHFGVGCDQLLLVEHPEAAAIDFRYRIFNADGGEVQQCGNGARCFARFVRDKGMTDKDEMVVETASGIITLYMESGGQVRVNMGIPRFNPEQLPLRVDREQPFYELEAAGKQIKLGAVSMGNPHAVIRVDDIDRAELEKYGPALESHPLFPERVNVGFMQVLNRDHIRLRVFERGAGETLACGTGACAAVAVGHRWGVLSDHVIVDLPGGELSIHWEGDGQPIWMTGPAEQVFEGSIEL